MPRRDIQYGDLVSYLVDIGENIGDPATPMFGRVMGLLTPNSSTRLGSTMAYRYLVRTFVPLPENFDDVDWVIRGEHVDVVHTAASKNLHLEWGTLPSPTPKTFWATVDEDDIERLMIFNADRDFLKQGGVCPRCGDKGEWIKLGLICKYHGKFAG